MRCTIGIELQLRGLASSILWIVDAAANARPTLMPPMHGRLVQCMSRSATPCAPGQTLAVLEAMKMEHTLAAPVSGRVRTLGASARCASQPDASADRNRTGRLVS